MLFILTSIFTISCANAVALSILESFSFSFIRENLGASLFGKMKVATLEKTNEELIAQLRQMAMDKESFNQLVHALQIADFVKFARYQPDATDNEKNFAVIQSAIKTLNNIA